MSIYINEQAILITCLSVIISYGAMNIAPKNRRQTGKINKDTVIKCIWSKSQHLKISDHNNSLKKKFTNLIK